MDVAIVPGTVLNSLVHNKMYPEPYYGMNNKLDRNIIPDLAKTGREFYTYWFRTEFDVPENYKDKIVWLQVDGINYRAEIWVNGYLLGNMSGMFKPEYINITDFARIGQKNAWQSRFIRSICREPSNRSSGELPASFTMVETVTSD